MDRIDQAAQTLGGEALSGDDAARREAAAAQALDAALADEQAAEGARTRRVGIGRFLFVAIVLLMLGLLGVRLLGFILPPAGDGMAPDLEITTFDGEMLRLSDLRGQPVVVNFWASWCGPCVAEAPILAQGWQDAQARNVAFLGIVVNSDNPAAAQAFLGEHGLDYPNGFDASGEWERQFGVQGIPATFFIDADGRIVETARGYLPNQDFFTRRLNQIAQ